jgi:hypothetical protein
MAEKGSSTLPVFERAMATANPCPACGKPMEHGFLVAEKFIEGARWITQKTRLGAGGEPLVEPDALGNQYIPGYRCAACRLLLLVY